MKQKKRVQAKSLAEMIILTTFIADLTMKKNGLNSRQVSCRDIILNSRETILNKVTEDEDSDTEIYDATDKIFNKYQNNLSDTDFIFVCRGLLACYIRDYAFSYQFLTHFRDVYNYSKEFAQGARRKLANPLELINDVRGCTRGAVLEIK